MKLGYVIYRRQLTELGVHEVYVVNPAVFALIESDYLREASVFDTATAAYDRAAACGLWEWRVGLR